MPCARPVDADAPLPLCTRHLLVAHDWIARDVGITDLLPAPCLLCGRSVGVRYPSGWVCATCEWRVGDVPDGEHPPPRVDVVYYLRWRDRIKIGTSNTPRQRIAALPHDEVLAFERGGRMLERRRHEQFAAFRFAGSEWFRRNEELDAHIAEVAAGVDDPWAAHARWLSAEIALRG